MAAIIQASRLASPNRRARVRQKVHVPAYATFGDSQSEMLDLYEVLDISENGLALHCLSPMEVNQNVDLCLDLAEAGMQISGTARVVWLDGTGRIGFGLPGLADSAKRQLSEWLFLNALAAAANAELPAARSEEPINAWKDPVHRPNYTDILSAASAVQKEAELLGSDLEAVLALVASRSQSLLRASGAAVAMEEQKDQESEEQGWGESGARTMICRASSGLSAPPVGVTLYVDSGFSGECVRSGKLLRCDDTEIDERVDRQSCRALGIRSLIAVPVRDREKIVGLLEVFSEQPNVFDENDSAVLQRLAETIQAAIIHVRRQHNPPAPPLPSSKSFSPPGSVLFASPPERDLATGKEKSRSDDYDKDDQDKVGGIRLPRAYLYLLFAAAATIFLVLGFLAEPWIQEKVRAHGQEEQHTVFASSKPQLAPRNASAGPADAANFAELQALADRGDPAAENALGLLYAAGDEKQGIQRDETEAARWFTKAAEHGSVPAQSKLGSLYWGGRGVKQDDNQAYFWTVLARASGDDASHALAPFIATRLTRAQRATIEQQAEQWLERYESASKPVAGR
ncbi:MAG: GAF domain-containing protein [Candidatus Sulfotelmatobacter sp.]